MAKQDEPTNASGEGSAKAPFTAFDTTIGELGGQRTESFSAPVSAWNDRHRRRLAETAALPGLLPVVGAQRDNGTATAVHYAPATPSLTDRITGDGRAPWFETAGMVAASARGLHAAHLDGLAHGSLTTDDVRVYGDDIAVAGTGMALGGVIPDDRHAATAPEVLAGGPATARSDVYSLGKVLERSIEGQPDVPDALTALAKRATSEQPSDRPVSAWFLAEGIEKAAGPRFKRFGLADLGAQDGFAAASDAYRPPITGGGTSRTGAAVAGAAGLAGAAGVAGMAAARPGDRVAGAKDAAADAAASAEGSAETVIEGANAKPAALAGAAAATGTAAAAGTAATAGGTASRVVRQDDDDDKGAIWPWAAAAIVGVGALGWLATRDGGDSDVDVAGTVQSAEVVEAEIGRAHV